VRNSGNAASDVGREALVHDGLPEYVKVGYQRGMQLVRCRPRCYFAVCVGLSVSFRLLSVWFRFAGFVVRFVFVSLASVLVCLVRFVSVRVCYVS
jgi:hypothetical protein